MKSSAPCQENVKVQEEDSHLPCDSRASIFRLILHRHVAWVADHVKRGKKMLLRGSQLDGNCVALTKGEKDCATCFYITLKALIFVFVLLMKFCSTETAPTPANQCFAPNLCLSVLEPEEQHSNFRVLQTLAVLACMAFKNLLNSFFPCPAALWALVPLRNRSFGAWVVRLVCVGAHLYSGVDQFTEFSLADEPWGGLVQCECKTQVHLPPKFKLVFKKKIFFYSSCILL